MKKYNYQNNLISKKQLKEILGWCFSNYNAMQSCNLADELKRIGFKYSTKAGISISIEDLKVPYNKNLMLKLANQDLLNYDKVYLKGKISNVERFQKITDMWGLTSDSLKNQIIEYFKNYDPLNSVYIMAFSGARGNFSQVRQLIGMRGLMSSPSGQVLNLAIKKNFREGLTITDYLISGYGARKGIVDTALKTANSGYLTRRLIDVAQDILIREKDCFTKHSFCILTQKFNPSNFNKFIKNLIGRNLNKPILKNNSNDLVSKINSPITEVLIRILKKKNIERLYIRSPFTCKLYRAICQNCYGWDLATENLIHMGEAIGILAGQSIGEPGTQLTMRTFHTGGVFESKTRKQVFNPETGLVKFSKFLKLTCLRTNRGEEVGIIKNPGYIILIPEIKTKSIIHLETRENMILFLKNNQYLKKGALMGEIIDQNRNFKQEVKPIICYNSGEMFVPFIKNKLNIVSQNKLFWLLSGQVYNSPSNSFINFYPDCKINQSSFVFRTKIINHYSGKITLTNFKKDFQEQKIKITSNFGYLNNSQFQKFKRKNQISNAILFCKNFKYLIDVNFTNVPSQKIVLRKTRKNQIAELLKNSYLTKSGGEIFYKQLNIKNYSFLKEICFYYNNRLNEFLVKLDYFNKQNSVNFPLFQKNTIPIIFKTLIWLEEETEEINCNKLLLLIQNKTFINKKQPIIPDYRSKNYGLINVKEIIDKNDEIILIEMFRIKYGLIYNTISQISKIILYEGESFFNKKILLCEIEIDINNDTHNKLLIRPIKIYEFPHITKIEQVFSKNKHSLEIFRFLTRSNIVFASNQLIKTKKEINLVYESLNYKSNNKSFKNFQFSLYNNTFKNKVNLKKLHIFCANNHIQPKLKYKNLKCCLISQKNQFIDRYTILLFLEAMTFKTTDVVKFKTLSQKIKQVLLISNENCNIIKIKSKNSYKLNDFIINDNMTAKIGKVIFKNKNFVIIQKGQPYFFPNCKITYLPDRENFSYRLIPSNVLFKNKKIKSRRNIYIKKIEILTLNRVRLKFFLKLNNVYYTRLKKFRFLKLFIKKNGELYSCLVPRFLKKFTVQKPFSKKKLHKIFTSHEVGIKSKSRGRTLCLKNYDIKNNKLKLKNSFKLIFVKFLEYPFIKSAKSLGLYSITEDYFLKENNSVFCKNKKFLETEEIVGLLKIEKEFSGDIVQGLPRIEEILEARKKKSLGAKAPLHQKKGILVQKTSLTFDFKFYKLGTTIRENEKANIHKLLKVYFSYYGTIKSLFFEQKKLIYINRVVSNFEGSYKSFKKVQSFIIKSVQSIYRSQGVNINDKHLEVIIQQMTTRVLITDEGNTPLLQKEILDIYHIKQINEIIQKQNKIISYYIPILFGITKASLNSPSFISAASFQETIRVLTNASIEGRIDWLRGLKESIIVGQLIPSGTGFRNYKKSFKNYVPKLFL